MTLDILPLLDVHLQISKPYITETQQQQQKQHLIRQRQNPNMTLDGYMLNHELRFIKKIGAGTYGLIYLVENIHTGRTFAAKMLLKQPPFKQGDPKDSSANKKIIQKTFYSYFLDHPCPQPNPIRLDYIQQQGHQCQFLMEISLHLKVHHHPNVMSIHQVFDLDNFAIVILLDYFEQGDLFGNIIDKQIFQNHPYDKQLLMKNAMLQLIDAVEYCHQNSVYHCDLKPENIMLRYNPNYKRPANSPIIDYNELHLVLIDFGLAMSSDLICCNACRGSSFYMAPERTTNFNTHKVVRNLVDMSQYHSVDVNNTTVNASNCKYLPTLAGDIWSLGVLFINITCARNPWPIASFNDNHNDVFTSYILNNNKDILSAILPISKSFNLLLDRIFKLNPNDRISLPSLYQEVIRCDFFNETTEEKQTQERRRHSHHHHSGHNHHHHHHHSKVVEQLEQIKQPLRKSNPQLFTPPETTGYNSYASEDENNIDDQYYTSENQSRQQQQVDIHKYYYEETKQTNSYTTLHSHLPKFNLETPSNSIVYLE